MAGVKRVILSVVLVLVLFFGLWLAIYAPTQSKLVIAYTFMPVSQAVPLSLFGAKVLDVTGSSVMTGGSGVICYIPEVTQDSAGGGAPHNFMNPGEARASTLRCVAVPTFQNVEPTTTVNWQYSTPSSLASTNIQSGTMSVQAGSYTDVPITITNNAPATTGYFSAIKYQFSAPDTSGANCITDPADPNYDPFCGGTAAGYAKEGVGYTLQNICSASIGGGLVSGGEVACGSDVGGTFVAPLGAPSYDAISGQWGVTQGNGGTTEIITQSTSTSTVTTVVSNTVTTSTSTEVVGENILTIDPLTHTQQVNLPIAGYLVAIFSGIGLFFVNRKQIGPLK